MLITNSRFKWLAVAGVLGAALLVSRAAAAQCTNDDECPDSACGGQICDWTMGRTCQPAHPDKQGTDGWCTTTDNCKCKGMGATCNTVYCTMTVPPAGSSGSGGSTAGSGGSSAGSGGSSAGSGGSSAGSGGSTGSGGSSSGNDAGTTPASNSGGGARPPPAPPAGLEEIDWNEIAHEATPELVTAARDVWTRSAFSEYASGAAFAEIAAHLMAARAPIDLIAAAGDFVGDEMFHAELASRVAMALGGALPLEVNYEKLVRPPEGSGALLRAAELVVRSCCVGESLTVPILKQSRRAAGSRTIEAVISRILRDEAQHAELGWWFLDWAELRDEDRAHLAVIAGATIRSFGVLFGRECARNEGLGALPCARFDGTFLDAVSRSVVEPLAARGIVVPDEDVADLRSAAMPMDS
jgi:hypothetical protein